MLILAAIEHHARHIWATVVEALTDRARGFSDREAGDFLTKTEAAKCSYCPVNDGTDCTLNCDCERRAYFRQRLVEREAEEDVYEGRRCSDCGGVDYWHGFDCPTYSARAGADPASVGTPAAEAPSPAAGVVPPAPAAGLPTRRPLPELLYAAAEAVSMPVTWGGAKQPAWRTRLAAELGDRAAELNRDAADARIAKRLNDAGFKAGEDFSAALDGQAFPNAHPRSKTTPPRHGRGHQPTTGTGALK